MWKRLNIGNANDKVTKRKNYWRRRSQVLCSFTKHHPQLQEPEFVRLAIHYYAKVLGDFDPHDIQMSQAALFLKTMIQSLINNGFKKTSKILTIADIHDVANVVDTPPSNKPREMDTTLFFLSTMERRLVNTFSSNVYVQHLAFSVAVLINEVIKRINAEYVELLYRSLRNMNREYNSGTNYADIQAMISVPNSAYLSALIGQ